MLITQIMRQIRHGIIANFHLFRFCQEERMKPKQVFPQGIELVLVLLLVTACAAPKAEPCPTTAPLSCPNTAALQTELTPTALPTMSSVEASPALSELGVEQTLEPTKGIVPTLQPTEVSTPESTPQVTQLYQPKLLGFVGGSERVAFSPNGDILAAGYYEGPVILYNTSTWMPLAVFTSQIGFINRIAFSPDGKLIAVGGGIYNPDVRGVQIWDVATHQLRFKLDDFDESVNSLVFSPNGAILATADGHPMTGRGSAKLWDVKTGELLAELTIQGKTDQLYIQAFSDIAFNPDGTLLAAINADGDVQLWDVISRKEVGMTTGVSGEGSGVAFSPDGKLLAASGAASGYTNTIPELRLWVVDTGELVFKLDGHNAAAGKVKFSPDGKILASTSFYDSDGTVMLWDVGTGEVLATIDVPGASDVAFSPNGTLLATAGWADGIRLWEVPPH